MSRPLCRAPRCRGGPARIGVVAHPRVAQATGAGMTGVHLRAYIEAVVRHTRDTMRLASAAAALGAAALIAALPAPAAVSARLVNKFDGWSLYAHDGPPAKICFSSTQPKSSDPVGARRD